MRQRKRLGKLGEASPVFFLLILFPCLATLAHETEPGGSTSGEGGVFIRGDSDQSGKLDITDGIFTLGFLFLGNAEAECLDALDADDDGSLSLTDAIAIFGYLFLGEADLPAPFTSSGIDPTPDAYFCDNGRFASIRRQIFARGCAGASCHSIEAAKGGLVLQGMQAYSELYQVPPQNEDARKAGLLRVKPGSPERSFLLQKLAGHPDPGDPALPPEEIELVRHWIEDGAVPSTPADIILPSPARGEQIIIPPFPVKRGEEVQRNYYFKLKSSEELWVDRIQFLYPPGSHHLNLFTGAPVALPDGSFEDNFVVVPFADWSLRAASQVERLDWILPRGVAVKFKAHEQILAQIHYVNIGDQTSPIGGCAAINLHAREGPGAPVPLGSMFLQNKNIIIRPDSEVSYDYGITFSHFGHEEAVKASAVTGHFHWRGKTFEIRRWDGQNKKPDDTPLPGEFDRMGPENTIFLSDNWDEPPFVLFGDDGPEFPPGWGIVYRTTYVNTTENLFCFGPHVATQEHSNAFLFFYPGPENGEFFWFPPDCQGQGCAVTCR